jgi:hypothetical protein
MEDLLQDFFVKLTMLNKSINKKKRYSAPIGGEAWLAYRFMLNKFLTQSAVLLIGLIPGSLF